VLPYYVYHIGRLNILSVSNCFANTGPAPPYKPRILFALAVSVRGYFSFVQTFAKSGGEFRSLTSLQATSARRAQAVHLFSALNVPVMLSVES
jgi:hypothetical protein